MTMQYALNKSELDNARTMKNRDYLRDVFDNARQVIEGGGTVTIEEEFSDARREVTGVISSVEALDSFRKKYL